MKENFDIDLREEKSSFISYMMTIERASRDIGREEKLIEQYQDKLTTQFEKMSSIIKSLKIENHNLKDNIIRMEGKTNPDAFPLDIDQD